LKQKISLTKDGIVKEPALRTFQYMGVTDIQFMPILDMGRRGRTKTGLDPKHNLKFKELVNGW